MWSGCCRPRLLFQHLPYSQQEKLQLSDWEVAVVVEGVLGVVDGQSFWGVSTPNKPSFLGQTCQLHALVFKRSACEFGARCPIISYTLRSEPALLRYTTLRVCGV